MTEVQTFKISGMTCGHCVNSVTEEVSAIVGVTDVEVTLETGTLKFTAAQPIAEDLVVAAVKEAGYEVVG